MFIRFVTDRKDEMTGQPHGVFSVAYELLEDDSVATYQKSEIENSLTWFKKNLPIPNRFSRSRKPHRESKGICWFKSSATECMKQVRYLTQMLTELDIIVRELATERPGNIIFEDEKQVVAEPFSSTPK